ncbi:hypothetical protein B0H10DRAFT_221998 [Mycena sp. CBHHK59/15]|nr:hypothetical protein B0H10DRAFT_221998 [Mycena sp. CBHHK59/15]
MSTTTPPRSSSGTERRAPWTKPKFYVDKFRKDSLQRRSIPRPVPSVSDLCPPMTQTFGARLAMAPPTFTEVDYTEATAPSPASNSICPLSAAAPPQPVPERTTPRMTQSILQALPSMGDCTTRHARDSLDGMDSRKGSTSSKRSSISSVASTSSSPSMESDSGAPKPRLRAIPAACVAIATSR